MSDYAEDSARVEAARIEALTGQYNAYVQWAERLVDRRAEANRFYVTLNLAIVGAVGFIYSDRFNGGPLFHDPVWMSFALAFAGLLVSHTWRCVIGSQRKIIGAKFEIIHQLEADLPSKPYTDENDPAKTSRKKVSAGRFELRMPTLFMLFHFILLIVFGAQIALTYGVGVIDEILRALQ
ncbi:MAG: hypothetical protein PVI23_16620 [Maricaulaceae bacterium]|jgi:hypothetical protein